MEGDAAVFWAAFGGGAAAGVFTLIAVVVAEWLRWFLDRPLLKVSTSLGYFAGSSQNEGAPYMFFDARNPHSKPVTVSAFGLDIKSSKPRNLVIVPQTGYQFPYKIEGGTSLSQWTSLSEVETKLQQLGQKPFDLKGVWFRSSSGETFRGRIDPSTLAALRKADLLQSKPTV